jgi:adenine-specific DNA-methyltransferase
MPTLQFKGRSVVWNHHLGVPYRELIPRQDKSLTDKISLHDNLIIHGDNLHALKALLPTYAGKVKCIYIDPPYNTGNEGWKYNDNVNSPLMKEWLGKEVGIDDEERHDKWLCMMTPRLKILRELLKEDGIMAISLDSTEVHRLRILMEELNYELIGTLHWKRKKQPSFLHGHIASVMEYLLLFSKNAYLLEKLSLENRSDLNTRLDNANNQISDRILKPGVRIKLPAEIAIISKGEYRIRTMSIEYLSDIQIVNGRTVNPVVVRARFRNKQSDIDEFIDDDLLFITVNYGLRRDLSSEEKERRKAITDLLLDWGDNQESEAEIKNIFPEKKAFDYPKPVKLIKNLLASIFSKDEIILDSFAGSGTTAHAVLALNKEDGGNRKFILVECEDYADNITAERVRRVIKGVPGARKPELREGLDGSFSYFELGKPIEIHTLLSGENLPSFAELARYVFFTATGEEINLDKIDQVSGFIGSAREYDIYMIYKPDVAFLRKNALTLDYAKSLPPHQGRTRVVFAPVRFLSPEFMHEYRVEFCQLPYELYRGLK